MDIQTEFRQLKDEDKCLIFNTLLELIALAKEEIEGYKTMNTDVSALYLEVEKLIARNKEIDFDLKSGNHTSYFTINNEKTKNSIDIKIKTTRIKSLCKERNPFIDSCLSKLESAFKIATNPKKYANYEKQKGLNDV